MSSAVRKQAPRPARPAARYWKGKAPKGVDVTALSESEDEEEQNELQEEGDVSMAGDQLVKEEDDEEEDMQMRTVAQKATAKTMNVTLKDVNISKDGKVIVAGREESGRTLEEEEGAFAMFCELRLADASTRIRRGVRGRGRQAWRARGHIRMSICSLDPSIRV